MQRLLQPYQIAIPFAPFIAERFPTDRVEARRLMPHLMSTIKSVCLLRQYQKRPENGVLVADGEDYRLSLKLITPTLRRLSDAADANVLRVLAERGFIVETQEGRGNRPAKFKLAPGAPEPDAASDLGGLPTPAEIPDQGGAV